MPAAAGGLPAGALRAGAMLILATVLMCVGCERSAPPQSATRPATTAPALTAAGNPVLHLRDWTANPPEPNEPADGPALEILSAAPNITEICCALRLGDQLVGRTRYCTYPPRIRDVTSIGDLYNLNVEVLLQLTPDLMLVSGHSRSIADRLDRLGLKYEQLPDVALDDLFLAIERVGTLCRRERIADTLISGIRSDLTAVQERYQGAPSRRVLVTTAPLATPPTEVSVAGPGSFYDELLQMAGHENIARPSGRAFTPLSLEYVLRSDPDVIVELVPTVEQRPGGDAEARAAWAHIGNLQAVRDQRVHALVGPQHFILGPRIAQTFAALCATISDNHVSASDQH